MTEQDSDVLSYVIFYYCIDVKRALFLRDVRSQESIQQSLACASRSKWAPLIACESVFRDAGRFIPFIVYPVLLLEIKFDLIYADNART